MDHIKILKRAWDILWSYRALWIFGIIIALTTAGGGSNGGGSSGSSIHGNQNGATIPQINAFFENLSKQFEGVSQSLTLSQQETYTLIGIGIVLGLVVLALIIVGLIGRYVSEAALMRMVDEYEKTGVKASIRQGFRYGWSRAAWRMFLIDLLLSLPLIVVIALLGLLGLAMYFLISSAGPFLSVPGIIGGIGLFFLIIFLTVICVVVLRLLQEFFRRACALEGVGVFEAFRRGWGLVRRHLKDVGLMWLIMIGLGIGWAIALFVMVILLIPVFIVTALVGLVAGGLVALLLGLLASLFLQSPWSWLVAAVIGLPIFFLVTGSPLLFLGGLSQVFKSNVWTLTYRELNALEGIAAVKVEEPSPSAQ